MSNLPDPEPQAPAEPSSRAGLAKASALLASGTFVSRILGFVSAIVLATVVGTESSGANTFALGNQLPNSIYAIIAGGLLSAVLVPQIVRAGLHDDGGQRFVNKIVTLGIVVFLVAAVVATAAAPLLVRLYAGGGFSGDELSLATAFAYWCLPQVLFYAIYSLLGEVLNARKIFGPFTWAPVLNNVVVISGLIGFTILFGMDPTGDVAANAWSPQMVALLGGTATLGVASQAVFLVFFWRKTGLGFRPDFRWHGVGLGATGRAALWVFGMILINQLAGVIETQVTTLAGKDNPNLFVTRTAWLIFMLPHSVATVSIATTYFTRMSTHARDGKLADVRNDLSSSLRAILLIITFSAVGLVVIANPFSALFAEGFDNIQGLSSVLIAYLVGLIPFSVVFVIQRTLYAIENTRAAFMMQVVQAVTFVALALTVPLVLPPEYIAVGIASSITIAGIVQAIAGGLILRPKIGGLGFRDLTTDVVQYFIAALPTAAAGVGVLLLLGGFADGGFAVSSKPAAGASMALIGGTMAVVYSVALLLLRNRDILAVVSAVRSRLAR